MRVRTLFCLGFLVVLLGFVAIHAQTTGPVASYSFEEGSGTKTADSSGNSNTGTLVNGPTWTTGKVGRALSFAGSNNPQYVNIGNGSSLNITGSMSIAAWIFATSPFQSDTAIVSKKTSRGQGYELDVSPDTGSTVIGFKLTNSSGNNFIRYGSTVLQTNQWYHIVGVYDSSSRHMDVYLNGQLNNGQLSGTIPSSQQLSNQSVNIATRPGADGHEFGGKIDEVRIYNRAVSLTDVQSLFTGGGGTGGGGVAPTITSANNTTFRVGTTGTFTVTATGSPAPTFSESGALPGGVTFNGTTGVLAGTPAAGTGGNYPITITALNGVAPNAVQSFALTVNQAPTITSVNNTTFQVGNPGTFTVTTTGTPKPNVTESGALPGGVTFSASTGSIQGTPSSGTSGNYPITFTAQNGVSPNAVQSFTLTVNTASPIPVITSPTSANGQLNSPFSYQITAMNSPTSFGATGLPSGLRINSRTGLISGTPTVLGLFSVGLRATNSSGTGTATLSLTISTTPTVTINQATGQADPTNSSPVNFTVTFSTPVTGFGPSGIVLGGNAGANAVALTGSGAIYNVAVSGMAQQGTVTATVAAGAANANGNPNVASTSTDNTVTYDTISPSVTINQAAAQSDPASASPINFAVVFNEPAKGFTSSSVTLGGTAGATTAAVTGSGATYNVAVSGMTQAGSVTASIGAGKATDLAGNPNTSSTSTDNSVTFNLPPPSVTINQASSQSDPTNGSTINFTAVFSVPVTGFTNADVIVGGTAGAGTAVVTGSGTTYNVAVSGMTQAGSVTASISAGAATANGVPNTASTSTDNTVTYNPNLAAGVPTLVQHEALASNEQTEAGNKFIINLPNPVLANNLVVIAMTYASSSGRTVSITDDHGGNTWVAGPSVTDLVWKKLTTSIFYSSGTAAGTRTITVTFDHPLINFQANISEFYNVATTSAVDVSTSNNASTAPSVSAGTISPTSDGDLIYSYGVDVHDGDLGGNGVSGFTAGPGFSLLSASQNISPYSEYLVQTSRAAINAAATVSGSSDEFNSVAIAFRAAAAGTAPGPGIRIVHELHTRVNGSTPVYLPSSGNLIVAATAYGTDEVSISSITDNKGNKYTKPAVPNYVAQILYAANATPGTTLIAKMSDSDSGQYVQMVWYDIAGAATSPFDVMAIASGNTSGNADVLNAPVITPTTSDGLVIVSMSLGNGPPSGMLPPFNFDAVYYTGQSDASPMDYGDGYAHYYNPNTSTLSFGWHVSNGGANTSYGATALAFKAANPTPQAPPQ